MTTKSELLTYLEKQGFSNKIIKAFSKVKREKFIPKNQKQYAYENRPLPLGYSGATISQPYVIAFMLKLLELTDNQKILEIGSGSGYVLALINKISKKSRIYGVERIEELVEKSSKVLKNKRNITVICGDGSKGLKKYAPYDRILISARAEKIPTYLSSQLKYNGIIVCPVIGPIVQIKRKGLKLKTKAFGDFIFVPLIEG